MYKFSNLTTRQPMVEFYLRTFPRFPLRKSFPLRKREHKSYFDKNRTLDCRTSRCAGYVLNRPVGRRAAEIVNHSLLCRSTDYVWSHVCMCMHSQQISKSMDQPVWLTILLVVPCPRSRSRIWSRETDSAVSSRASLLNLHTQT